MKLYGKYLSLALEGVEEVVVVDLAEHATSKAVAVAVDFVEGEGDEDHCHAVYSPVEEA